MNKPNRNKVPKTVLSEVMHLSDRKCCIDQKERVQLHHIDGNPNNNNIENLALLCLDCHDDATKTGSLSRKLDAETIKRFRKTHYETIQANRDAAFAVISQKNDEISPFDLVNATIQGCVLVEIAKIRLDYVTSKQDKHQLLLTKLSAFSEYNFPRVCYELFTFLDLISFETRSGPPLEKINSITFLVKEYFPVYENSASNEQILQVGSLAVNIAYGIIYDTSIYIKKYGSMKEGYDLLLYIFVTADRIEHENLKKLASEKMNEIESNLNRPEREDLNLAKVMLNSYKELFDSNKLSFPTLNEHLWEIIQSEK